MYDAIAAYKEVFLYLSLSTLFAGGILGVIISLFGRYYRFTIGSANVFVHISILYSYVECYAHQAFPSQHPTIKVCLSRYNKITVILNLFKRVDGIQVFEQVKKDLANIFSCYLGHQKPLFLVITYLRKLS